MRLKDHIPPTLHNAVGGLITVAAVAALGCLAAWPTKIRLVTAPFWSIIVAGLVVVSGFVWTVVHYRRRMASLNRQLDACPPAHDFLDDYEFVEKLGAYKHNTKPGYFCANCTAKRIVSPLRDAGHGWQCEIKECGKFYVDPSRPQPKPAVPQAIFTPRRLGPGDMRMG
ncbi:MAG TPA: hypothetical protein VG167_07375 [Verrucomicrobiae bacterium]|nr:hypothetical protein [Verrucomicrobiae bacterium]